MSPLIFTKVKQYTKYIMAISLCLCSLWLVWDLCVKYFSKATTVLQEQEYKEYLPLPHFLLCSSRRYKKDELANMELPADFFDNYEPETSKFIGKGSFPDLNRTWQRATWNLTDFEADWEAYEGVVLLITHLF